MRILVMLVFLVLEVICYQIVSAQPYEIPNPAQVYEERYPNDPIIINTHCHTSHSDAVGHGSTPEKVVDRNLQTFDGLFLTDHGGHIKTSEWIEQLKLSLQHASGLLCLRGFEITGTDELSSASSKNPAYQPGWGHIIVLGTDTYTDRRTFGNGELQEAVETFVNAKSWLLRNHGLAIFAHPSLYTVEESFNGFAPPSSTDEVQHFVGCELSSHSLAYTGLGDGISLRSSNEACFRTLLRVGWRVSPYMSGDEHTPPFGDTHTVTGMYSTDRSQAGILEAMRARRTFATEEPGSFIQLIATADTNTVIMGESICPTQQLIVHARCRSSRNTVKKIELVFVSKRDAFYDLTPSSQLLHKNDDHWGMIIDQQDIIDKQLILVYAKAKLSNGRNLVSAPIWFDQTVFDTP